MEAKVAQTLVTLNKEFYQTLAEPFSASRGRLQPGVKRVLNTVPTEANILDLGCGNGNLAAELARRGQRGNYVGVDGSAGLLAEAEKQMKPFKVEGFRFKFVHVDITSLESNQFSTFSDQPFGFVFAFAVLHHIPGRELRVELLKRIHEVLSKPRAGEPRPYDSGIFIHSNWQFLNSHRLRERIQPWSKIGLDESHVDPGDYLLDWRSGGSGLRYVHQFSESELRTLADECGFQVQETFLSDGKSGDLSLHSVWTVSKN